MGQLPTSWMMATVGDVTLPYEVAEPSRSPDKQFTYIDIGSIDNVRQEIASPRSLLGSEAPSRARRIVRAGDTLFSTVRTYLKNIALVPEGLDGVLTSTGIAILRPCPSLNPRYVFYWAKSDEFVTAIGKSEDGTMYPAVRDADIADGPIPLAPTFEQHRIVAKLDSLFDRSTRARRELDRVPRLIERYKQAILSKAFSGELTVGWRERRGGASFPWRASTVGALARDIRYGTAAKCSYAKTATPVLRIPNIGANSMDLDDLKYAVFSEAEVRKLRLAVGDLLIIRSNGSLGLVGRTAIVTDREAGLLYAGYLIRVRLDGTKIFPRYLHHLLSAPETRQHIEALSKSTSGVNNINSEQISGLAVPLPSLEEQAEIVRRIDVALAWLDKIATEHARADHLLPKLNQAILAKAFKGELVAQDPSDEPASVLLDRIRTEREGSAHSRSRRTRRSAD